MWVNQYLLEEHGEARAHEIIADIDHRCVTPHNEQRAAIHLEGDRISAVPAFPGLRRFPDGRDFQQWTGDDSMALMKVRATQCEADLIPY